MNELIEKLRWVDNVDDNPDLEFEVAAVVLGSQRYRLLFEAAVKSILADEFGYWLEGVEEWASLMLDDDDTRDRFL